MLIKSAESLIVTSFWGEQYKIDRGNLSRNLALSFHYYVLLPKHVSYFETLFQTYWLFWNIRSSRYFRESVSMTWVCFMLLIICQCFRVIELWPLGKLLRFLVFLLHPSYSNKLFASKTWRNIQSSVNVLTHNLYASSYSINSNSDSIILRRGNEFLVCIQIDNYRWTGTCFYLLITVGLGQSRNSLARGGPFN